MIDQLDPAILRWMGEAGWKGLRPVQEAAVAPVLAGRSLIVAAPTAGGKTEAAFLPLLTKLAQSHDPMIVLAISPLKALINDQHRRLTQMSEHIEGVSIHRWHGDVSSGERSAARRVRRGVVLITPESIEAQLQSGGQFITRLIKHCRCIVIDEMHVFLDGERGVHLRSLMQRLESMRGATVPLQRIGLSATLADFSIAQRYLVSHDPDSCMVIDGHGEKSPFKAQLRSVVETEDADGIEQVAQHLFERLRGQSNLVFANSKRNVEQLTDQLSALSRQHRVPNEFVAHHGNLSKDLRAQVESQLQSGDTPTTAVCTSTMELGVDIGEVASVAQVGAPYTVASLRQRLGRSGRRGGPAILRCYVIDAPPDEDVAMLDLLHTELFQASAMIELMLARWLETPSQRNMHLSTLVHQIMAILGQLGAAPAGLVWRQLSPTFTAVDIDMFKTVLKDLAANDIIYQLQDGLLALAPAGDRIVNGHDFYAAFATPEEFRVMNGGRSLGTLPVEIPLPEGATLIFAGKRWTVLEMNTMDKTISVRPGATGNPPKFGGTGGSVDQMVHERMFRLYTSTQELAYLDDKAQELFAHGRRVFESLQLETNRIVPEDKDVYLFPWSGDHVHTTMALWLRSRGIMASVEGLAVRCSKTNPDNLLVALQSMYEDGPPDAMDLAQLVAEPGEGKYHHLLSATVRRQEFAAAILDVDTAHEVLTDLV